ncbi:fibronectin type III domain-containing protein [Paenibacillus elgii]|uniref:fibronectin type III domain-containing protein n=1 Tax=Paenibacillus elgii TaxID=189691 RepID=UPI000FD723C1|nr:fibronectin type III domain-containing protein [Paenibacillus elgii]NEN86181.1 fibronectin type III domain-containing protein [Paenibacillus elgii]
MQYQIRNDDLKMELHLNDQSAPKSFQFLTKTSGLEIQSLKDGSINFVNQSGKVVFYIPPMWVRDSSNSELRYDRISVDVSPKGEESIITLTLNDQGLKYPIVIDPTTVSGHTFDEGGFPNKLYVDTPDINTKSILNIRFSNWIYESIEDNISVNFPMEVYLTKKEYGKQNNFSRRSPAPGDDGNEVVHMGKTSLFNDGNMLEVSGNEIRSKFGSNAIVYGGAFYKDFYPYPYPMEANIMITYNAAEAPTGLKYTSTLTSIDLSWTSPANSNEVQHYEVYQDSKRIGTTTKNSYTITGLPENKGYTFFVKAVNKNGDISDSSEFLYARTQQTPDTTPPTVPFGINILDFTHDSIELTWGASTDDRGLAGYQVYVNDKVFSSPTNHYKITGLKDTTTYNIFIRAIDFAGNLSEPGIVRTVVIPDMTRPTPPTNLVLKENLGKSVSLEWGASTDNVGVVEYEVFAGTNKIGSSTNTSFTTPRYLDEAIQYQFTVRAKDAAGNVSEPSNALIVTTLDVTRPTPPTGLHITETTETTVSLSWNPSTDNIGVVEYDIYDGANLIASSKTNNYVVTNLRKITRYQFNVRAKDAAGNVSEASNFVIMVTKLPSGMIDYHYNAAGKLEYMEFKNGERIWFDYDANGNLLRSRF